MPTNIQKKRRGRPIRGEFKRVRVSFTLPPNQVEWLTAASLDLGMSKSVLLEEIIHTSEKKGLQTKTKKRIKIPIPTQKITRFCEMHHIKTCMLFGSVIREDFNRESDVDVLVEFKEGHTPGLFGMVTLANELSQILGRRKVDLKTPDELSDYFRDDVLTNAELLYAA